MPVYYNGPQPGLGSVGQYQMSGIPWITGSLVDTNLANNGQVHVEFPFVTKNFTVINKTDDILMIHFDSRANPNVEAQRHFVTIPSASDGFNFNVRCKDVYVSMSGSSGTGSFELFAELTAIERTQLYVVSGSGINEITGGYGY